jgi:anti-sigma B factor antagonist
MGHKDAEPGWRGGFLLAEETVPWGRLAVLAGELDMDAAPLLRDWLTTAIEGGTDKIVLDFSDVTFVDSLSLAAVVAAKRRLGPGGRLAVVVDNPYVLLIFEAGGLDSVFEVFASRDAAVEHVGG